MSWLILALAAAFLYAFVNILDKFIVTKLIKNPLTAVIALGPFGIFGAAVVYIFHGVSPISTANMFLSILSGVIAVVATSFYFKAAKIEEISRVIPVLYMNNFFILILATIFLGEVFTLQKYIGIFLLVFGAIFISSEKFDMRPRKAFWIMMAGGIIYAINAVLIKYLLSFTDFWTIFSYSRVGVFLAVLPLFYLYHKDLFSILRKQGLKVAGVLSLDEIISLSATIISFAAVSIGPVSLVSAIYSVQPFFVLMLSVAISTFLPKILKEKIDRKTLLLKAAAIAAVIIGAVLIA